MSQKHFVIDMDYLNDLACNIAENVPEKYHKKFLIELSDYMKCASFEFESSDAEDMRAEAKLMLMKNMKFLRMRRVFMNLLNVMLKIVMRLVKKKKNILSN
jgi:hypothetical protein